MSVSKAKPKFLYPRSRQFPVDEVAEKIVRAIEKRNWKVPGIRVEFDTYGSWGGDYLYISTISGDNFKLHFARIQGKLSNGRNDIAAVHQMIIPKEDLSIFHDESGPSYVLYVGENWERDKEWFMTSSKFHDKMNNKPKRYLRYTGDKRCKRSENLVSDKDNREYEPEGEEPTSLNLEETFERFEDWMEKNILSYILSFPEADVIKLPVVEKPVLYKGKWPLLFTICDFSELGHMVYSDDKDMFNLCKFDGIWCDVNQKINVTSSENDLSEEVMIHMISSSKIRIVAIRPIYANDIYVMDQARYTKTREEILSEIAPRTILTDEELQMAINSRSESFVPINEYKGGYEDPIVVIYREIGLDEIEWMKK